MHIVHLCLMALVVGVQLWPILKCLYPVQILFPALTAYVSYRHLKQFVKNQYNNVGNDKYDNIDFSCNTKIDVIRFFDIFL